VCPRDRLPLKAVGFGRVMVKSERCRLSGVLSVRETLVVRGGRGRGEMVVRRVKRARKERKTWLRCVNLSYQRESRPGVRK
jgi:hypothetical protein